MKTIDYDMTLDFVNEILKAAHAKGGDEEMQKVITEIYNEIKENGL